MSKSTVNYSLESYSHLLSLKKVNVSLIIGHYISYMTELQKILVFFFRFKQPKDKRLNLFWCIVFSRRLFSFLSILQHFFWWLSCICMFWNLILFSFSFSFSFYHVKTYSFLSFQHLLVFFFKIFFFSP